MIASSYLTEIIRTDLQTDIGSGDITAELISDNLLSKATIITREPAILCGIPFADEVYRQVDSHIALEWQCKEGDRVAANQILVELAGPARSIVTGERCALNWLQTLSGTATMVRRYVDRLKGTRAQLLDTRKTLPGLRVAQKYAVTIGGGRNHRMGLFDAYLIKENHIASCGSITQAVIEARALHPERSVEVEVENLKELEEAIAAKVDVVMLDNFSLQQIQEAVHVNHHRVKLEVSGGVDLDHIHAIAQTGIDYISVGALTKHVQAIDLSLRMVDA